MILKGISVNQDPPTKDYLWITPKGNTRFWDQSTWRLIGGSGGTVLPEIEAAGKYLATTGTSGNYSMVWVDGTGGNYLPLTGGTMTGDINTLNLFPVLKDTYSLGSETLNYTRIFGNVIYPGNNNNLWLKSNATSGSAYGIVFGHGGVNASTTLGKWTYTGLGIGTDSPGYKLDVSGKIKATDTIIAYRYSSANNLPAITLDKPGSYFVGIGADGTSNRVKFGPCSNMDGNAWIAQSTFNSNQWFFQGYIHATNGIDSESYVTALATNSSDKRLKKEIKPFNAKQIIDKLKPVEFEWNKKANKYNSNLELNKKNYGLIAQDSDGIIDNLVFDLPDGKGYKGVRYEKLIPILLQAVKEQQKEIDELKQIIKKLKV